MDPDPIITWMNVVLGRPTYLSADLQETLYTPFQRLGWMAVDTFPGYELYFHHWQFASPCKSFIFETTVFWGDEEKPSATNEWSYDIFYNLPGKGYEQDPRWTITANHGDQSKGKPILVDPAGQKIKASHLTDRSYLMYIKTRKAHQKLLKDFCELS